jgi:hypothetical protein
MMEEEEGYFAFLPALMMERADAEEVGKSKIVDSYRMARVGVKMCFGGRTKH